jgi:hypothetical protein
MIIIDRIKSYLAKNSIEMQNLFNTELTNRLEGKLINTLDFLGRIKNYDSLKMMKAIFEAIDYMILKDPVRIERWKCKGLYKRTIIFENGVVTFWRRKYIIKDKYAGGQYNGEKTTCFLFDKFFGLQKYQRLELDLQLNILSKIGENFSYQDIANFFPNSGITKQTIFHLIRRFDEQFLIDKQLEPSAKKLNHNGYIYIENDDGFVNALASGKLTESQLQKKMSRGWKKNIRTKCISLFVVHTGMKKNGKRNVVQNKRCYITMQSESHTYNNKRYWNDVMTFVRNNYNDVDSAKIIVLGDGATKIKACEKYINCTFALDKFHPTKMIKDSLRGNRAWKLDMRKRMQEAIFSFNWTEFVDLIAEAIDASNGDPNKIELLSDLLNYVSKNWIYIEKWREPWYQGCRIEAYMSQLIKVAFRSRPKIFNELTIKKFFLIKELIKNGVDIFEELIIEANEICEIQYQTYKHLSFNVTYYETHKVEIPNLGSKSSGTNLALRKLIKGY